MADVADRQPDPLAVLRQGTGCVSPPGFSDRPCRVVCDDCAAEAAALAQVEALVEAAREVSRIEATGVLPDFQPLADALAPFPRKEQT